MAVFQVLTRSLIFSYSTLHMVTQLALLIASKVMPREISLLSSGMCLVMNDTKIVALFFIHKLMVSINILLIHNDGRFPECYSRVTYAIQVKLSHDKCLYMRHQQVRVLKGQRHLKASFPRLCELIFFFPSITCLDTS